MIALLIVGVVVYCAGDLRVTRSVRLEGKRARQYGVTLMLTALPLELLVRYLLGLVLPQSVRDHPVWPWAITYTILVACLVLLILPFCRKIGPEEEAAGSRAMPPQGEPGSVAPAGPHSAAMSDARQSVPLTWGQATNQPGCLVAGLAKAFAVYNLFSLAVAAFLLSTSSRDDWGLASVISGMGALVSLILFLPAQIIFAMVARSLNLWARIALVLSLIAAICVGAAPAVLRDLKFYAQDGRLPEVTAFGWTVALGSLPVTLIAVVLGYLLSRMYRKSLENEASKK
jgi:hypothetical protein